MVYEPCYNDLPAAAEQTDPPAAADEQVFPDYDNGPDPAPVYDCICFALRSGSLLCVALRSA